MRLGVDGRVLAPPETGVARYLRGLLSQWPALRRPDDLLELLVDRELAGVAPVATVVRVFRWPFPGGDPAWRQLRLAPALHGRGFDLLFCPFYTIPLASRVPAVVTIHDVSFVAHPEWFRARARLAFRLATPSAFAARKVLTPSRFSAGEITRWLGVPSRRIEVTPLGLAPGWLEEPSAKTRRGARDWLGWDGPYLLHLGAVHTRRNVDLFVRAFARLGGSFPDLRLVIAGPELRPAPDLARLCRDLGCEGRVLRRPWVPEELLAGLLAEADVLGYLSEYEGFGIPALEALACGTPVLALRRASLPEVLGDAAVWVESKSVSAVEAALGSLLGDASARRDLAAAGLCRARRFTWRRCAEMTFQLLRNLAG